MKRGIFNRLTPVIVKTTCLFKQIKKHKMVVNKYMKKKSKKAVVEYNSDSEPEISYDYKADDDESDDAETEEESNTSQSPKGKKRKCSKRVSFAEPRSDEDEANDASDEDDDHTIEQTRKKKQKMSKHVKVKTKDSDDDDDENDDDEDDDTDSEDDSDSDNSDENGEKVEEDEVKAHTGFANALSNILSKKTASSKKVILALGKTDKEIQKLKASKLPPEERTSVEVLTTEELEERRLKRKLWLELGKVKPNVLEKKHEKELKMVATKGVVQLFNAVRKQQKLMNESLSSTSTERKKDMVIESMNKKSFINLLQNTKVDVSMKSAEKETVQTKEDDRKIWSVLKDDFVIGTGNMKDWDKLDMDAS